MTLSDKNHLGTDQLRKGRISISGARYFVTIRTQSRREGLDKPEVRESIFDTLRALHQSEDICFHCATVMPDHLHSLFTLGSALTLSQTQGKFKVLTKQTLQAAGLFWQNNYYDHRIRNDRFLEPFARYIFLNPYRKRLLSIESSWPGWLINKHYKPEFTSNLTEGVYPPIRWLRKQETISDIIEQDTADTGPHTDPH